VVVVVVLVVADVPIVPVVPAVDIMPVLDVSVVDIEPVVSVVDIVLLVEDMPVAAVSVLVFSSFLHPNAKSATAASAIKVINIDFFMFVFS
jgi:hypothetical protein